MEKVPLEDQFGFKVPIEIIRSHPNIIITSQVARVESGIDKHFTVVAHLRISDKELENIKNTELTHTYIFLEKDQGYDMCS